MDTIHNMTSLALGKVQLADAGKYAVTFSNNFGSAELSIKVIVIGKPSAPENLRVVKSDEKSVSIEWDKPSANGGSEITGYVIEKREPFRRAWQMCGSTADRKFTLLGLKEGEQYQIRVAAENEVGTGESAELMESITPKSPYQKPSPPQDVEVSDIYSKTCYVSWKAPRQDGGSPITGYWLERRTTASSRWARVNREPLRDLNMDIKDLIEMNNYEFRVIAENKMGPSEPSEPSKRFTAKDPWDKPGPPKDAKVTKTEKQNVTLKWSPPDNDGGAAIKSYVIEYRAEGAFKWVRANEMAVKETEFTVRSLKENTVYEFQIAAENKAGVGSFVDVNMPDQIKKNMAGKAPQIKEPLSDVTVIVPNEAVLECGIEAGEPKATIRWFKESKEIYQGTHYNMESRAGVAMLVVKNVTLTDTGNYRCEASNKLATVATNGSLTVHEAPKIDQATLVKEHKLRAGHSLILQANITGHPSPNVTWTHKGKEVQRSADVSIDTTDTYSTLTIKGSSKVHSGSYMVAAVNKVGSDSAEITVNIKDKPSPPSNLEVTEVGRDFISVMWEEPESDGGAPITHYVIEKRDASQLTWLTASSVTPDTRKCTVGKLNEGKDYVIRVCAENEVGTSVPVELSKPVRAKLPFDPPSAPKSVIVEDVTKNSATIEWEAPRSDGGSPLIGYIIEKKQSFSSRWTPINKDPVTRTKLRVDDLDKGTNYEFRVVAVNNAGQSEPSKSTGVFKAKDPYDVPSKPGQPHIDNITADTMTVSWTAPEDDGGSPVTGYLIEKREAGDMKWTKVTEGKMPGNKYTLTGLTPEMEYEVRVTAENKAGHSQPSASSVTAKYVEPVEFTKRLNDLDLKEMGVPVTLECEVSKEGCMAQWFKDGTPLFRDEKYDIKTRGRSHALIIEKTKAEDAGEYSVVIKNAKCSAAVSVQVPPKLVIDDRYKDTIVLRVGTSCVIEIPFTASPQPKVSWLFNGGDLPDINNTTSETIKNMTALTLNKVKSKFGGSYQLNMKNDHGQASFTFKVVVLDKPGPVENLKITDIDADNVTLKWDKPSSTGGAPITRYTVEKRELSRRTWQPIGVTKDCEMTAGNLLEGSQYVFHVFAENECGRGDAVELAKPVTPKSQFAVPEAPAKPKVKDVTKNSCLVTWQPPAGDGGTPLTGYWLERKSSTSPRWVRAVRELITDTEIVLVDLIEGCEYQFRVVAENKMGSGPESDASDRFTAKDQWEKPGKPGVPKIVDVDETSVSLKWSPPKDDGGSDIYNYVIEYRLGSDAGSLL